MRSGTLLLVVVVNAAVAAGVVFLALEAFPPAPVEQDRAPAETRTDADLENRVAALRREVEALRGLVEQYRDGSATREEVAELRRRVEERPAAPAEEEPAELAAAEDASPGDRETREAARAFFRGIRAGARQRSRQMLESLADPTPESIQQAEQRVRRDAERLGRRLDLSPDRVAQVEQALLDIDRRTREKMRVAINAKGVDNVTYEDAKPLVDESFAERERAMSTILAPEELEGFKQQEQQTKAMLDMGLRLMLPPESESGEEEGR